MASLYKKTRTKADPKTGKPSKVKSSKWWIKFRDAEGIVRRVPGFTDKAATQQYAASMEREAELGRAGVRDPFAKHRGRPLTEQIADFEQHLNDKGDTADQVKLVTSRVRKVVLWCKFRVIEDVSPSKVEAFLAGLRKGGTFTQTSNHYLRAIKQFTRWLVLDRRHSDNVLTHLSTMNVEADRRRVRRPLTTAEFERLIESAENGPTIWKMTGHDRATLYIIGAYTGFRKGELNSVTPLSFNFSTEPPTLTVEAGYSKRRRKDAIPLRLDFAARLKAWLTGKQPLDPDRPLFSVSKNASSGMIRADLERAGIPYVDANGHYADFHALRKTFVTNLARSGASPKAAQSLARHSDINLTMNTYTLLGLQELASDVEALPPVPGKKPPAEDSEGAIGGENGQPGPAFLGAQIGALGAQIGALQATSEGRQQASNGTNGRDKQGSYEKTRDAYNTNENRALGISGHQGASPGIKEQSGGGGIRTHGWLAPTPVFETGPFNHSGTPPDSVFPKLVYEQKG